MKPFLFENDGIKAEEISTVVDGSLFLSMLAFISHPVNSMIIEVIE